SSTGLSLAQPLAGKGLSRSGLEVVLKFSSPALIGKRVIAYQSPRSVLRRVDRTAGIVGSNALSQIRGEADIASFGKRVALNEIDVEHDSCRGAACALRSSAANWRKPAEA